jgi:predicted DNA-binding transcriptional regulator YafY
MSETLRRQWQTLQLIPRLPKSVPVARIHADLQAKEYAVTRRTVERDLLELMESFSLEVDATQRPQLWSWSADSLPLDLPRMSQSEALTMLMAREYLQPIMPASTMAQMARYFDLAHQRIENEPATKKKPKVARLPESNWRTKVRVLPSTQPLLSPKINSEALAVIQEALLQGVQCDVTYLKRDAGKHDEYPIHPLGLVQRGTMLYLACTIKSYSDIKLLALHRVKTANLRTEPAKTPDGFSLDTYIASGALGWDSTSKTIKLKVAFAAATAVHLNETPLAQDQLLKSLSDGRVQLTATIQLTQQLVWWLLGFGDAVEVLEPLSLRTQISETARRMVANYTP